ncbi:hypothetical protein [Vitreimonas sp.]|uniref:hypothetical protein n=1 Tax=Vitreimonas sp. TaxID=3069702 RepID=UPI002EDB6090
MIIAVNSVGADGNTTFLQSASQGLAGRVASLNSAIIQTDNPDEAALISGKPCILKRSVHCLQDIV